MGNKKLTTGLKRKRTWSRYYNSKTPDREGAHDWIHKECLECGEELILEYKRRNSKFCNLSCSTSYRNKHKKSTAIKAQATPKHKDMNKNES